VLVVSLYINNFVCCGTVTHNKRVTVYFSNCCLFTHTPIISAVQSREAFLGLKNSHCHNWNSPFVTFLATPARLQNVHIVLGLHDQGSRRVVDETVGGRRPHRRVVTWSGETTIFWPCCLSVLFSCVAEHTATYLYVSVYKFSSVRWFIIARPL